MLVWVTESNPSAALDISDDGRFVCFLSNAENLHPIDDDFGIVPMTHVYVHDRDADDNGIFDENTPGAYTTTLIDWCLRPDGQIGRAYHSVLHAAMSADARYVAFHTKSGEDDMLCPRPQLNQAVFLADRVTGAITNVNFPPPLCDPKSEPEVVEDGGTQGRIAITPDGRYLAYGTYIWDRALGCSVDQEPAIVVYDSVTGTREFIRYVPILGVEDELVVNSISADGQLIAFYSPADSLVPSDTNGYTDCFIYDRGTGVTTLVSVGSMGQQGDQHSVHPQISRGGRYVTFYSAAENFVTPPPDTVEDVFLRDLQTGDTWGVSVSNSGQGGNRTSHPPSDAYYRYDTAAVSSSGRYVAFASDAFNLVTGDTNDATDVFVRYRGCEGLILCDSNCDGTLDAFTDGTAIYMAVNFPELYAQTYPDCDLICNNDINGDGVVDHIDFVLFWSTCFGP